MNIARTNNTSFKGTISVMGHNVKKIGETGENPEKTEFIEQYNTDKIRKLSEATNFVPGRSNDTIIEYEDKDGIGHTDKVYVPFTKVLAAYNAAKNSNLNVELEF